MLRGPKQGLVEADLSRFHGLDLRDLWRVDEQGRPKLTYRMVYVRIKALPPDSSLAIAANGGKRPWTISEYLLADLWEQQANRGLKRGATPRRHPARPSTRARRTPEQQRRHEQAMRRHRRQYRRRHM